MIKSVEFPLDGSGYLYERVEKPEKREKNSRYIREGSYEKAMEEYKEEMKYYRKHKGEFVLSCTKNLIGKTFNFQDGKINVLFGANGSGKTTILRTIAGNAMIEDGFTSFSDPLDFGFQVLDLDEDKRKFEIENVIRKMMKNSAIVEWDGVPIYYDNFENTRSKSNGVFGDLVGSVLQDTRDEIMYHLMTKSISAGQNTMYIFNKILSIVSKPVSLKEICDAQLRKFRKLNDVWNDCGNAQYEWFSKYERFGKEAYPTLIFDEIDKSLDIETVWKLYAEFLPALVDKFKNQVILVSHSPLILTDRIYNNPAYNIISLDEYYTNDVKKLLKDVKF